MYSGLHDETEHLTALRLDDKAHPGFVRSSPVMMLKPFPNVYFCDIVYIGRNRFLWQQNVFFFFYLPSLKFEVCLATEQIKPELFFVGNSSAFLRRTIKRTSLSALL